MRLSEVYLIAAAASVTTAPADAHTYVNVLVAHRYPSLTGYTSTGATLTSDIVQERRKKLTFVGDRLFDLNRLKHDIILS